MQQVEVTRRVAAAPAAVWRVLTELEHATERMSQITELHVITPGPYALGTRWRETRRMLGSSETQELTVVDNDPLRRTVLEAVDGATRYTTTVTLEELEPGTTLLTMTFGATGADDPGALRKLAMRVVGPLGTKLTERVLRTEVEDVAAAAEALQRG